jgi:hypothetical protein
MGDRLLFSGRFIKGKTMRRKTCFLTICSGVLFVFGWTAGLTQRAMGQEKPLWFPFNGKTWFLLGVNYPWYNGYRGLDLGPYLGSKTIATVAFASPRNSGEGHDVQFPSIAIRPGITGFNADGIEAQLTDMQTVGIHVLRWFFGNDGRSFMIFDQHDTCAGIDSTACKMSIEFWLWLKGTRFMWFPSFSISGSFLVTAG